MRVYQDPAEPRLRPNLVTGLMELPSTSTQSPEENQLSETLAWLLDRSPVFARSFAQLFFDPDSDAAHVLNTVDEFGAETRISLPPLLGTGALFPDLSLCGSKQTFQLLVEVKVDASLHSHPHEFGALTQPEAYMEAWRQVDRTGEAQVRAVGTLTRGDVSVGSVGPMRARDVRWDELRSLLVELIDDEHLEPGVLLVAVDFVEAIDVRVLGRTKLPAADELEDFLDWADLLIRALSPELAKRGLAPRKHVSRQAEFVGTYVDLQSPDGVAVELWIFASPIGGRYNLPGLAESLGVRLGAKGGEGDLGLITPARIHPGGFAFVRDNEKNKDFRVHLPLAAGSDISTSAVDAALAIQRALNLCAPPLLRPASP